jgi:hypothetical protein
MVRNNILEEELPTLQKRNHASSSASLCMADREAGGRGSIVHS